MEKRKRALLESVRNTRNTWAILGGISMFLGLMLFFLTAENMAIFAKLFGIIFGFIFIISSIFLLYKSFTLLNPKKSKIYNLILKRPLDVVWVYTLSEKKTVADNNIFSTTTMFICDRYGIKTPFLIKNKLFDDVFSLIESNSPNATIGYQVDLEKQFRRNPLDLLKD